eukprot:195128-Rhodomonas_salina.1
METRDDRLLHARRPVPAVVQDTPRVAHHRAAPAHLARVRHLVHVPRQAFHGHGFPDTQRPAI